MPTKPKKGEYTTYNVDAKTFVTVWQESSSVKEVVEALQMPAAIVHARASGYRNMGIDLKSMPRNMKNKVDVDGLNKHISEINERLAREGKPVRPADERASVPPLDPARIAEINEQVVGRKGRKVAK